MPRLVAGFFIFALSVLLVGAVAAKSQDVALSDLKPTSKQKNTIRIINDVLERYHYRQDVDLDDDLARQIFDNFLEALDPHRSYFFERDIQRFERGVQRLDDNLKQGDLDLAFDMFRVFRGRVDRQIAHALVLVDQDHDFDARETYQFDRSEAPWAKTEAELDEVWRKRVKNDFLSLRLAGKSDTEVREKLRQRYEGVRRHYRQFDSDDVFDVLANAYAQSLEPHTSYMSASTSENFDISMRLSLQGIGAVLRSENEYTVVQRTIPGGPARASKQIHAGDRIIGVGQGVGGTMDDVVGWRLQDVVDKIRGRKDSVVRLLILPKSAGPSGRSKTVILMRKEIKLADQAAKSYVVDGLGNAPGVSIGVIEVPAFYRDFGAERDGKEDFRSTTADVRRLVEELEAKGVAGLIVDLRGNGGGSLKEATDLTGLFIAKGPVVQMRDSQGNVEVETDSDPTLVYSGPLAVLVDRESASASEIFAGAIQDYGRGIVIGEPTFGKGTVQTLVDLNRFIPRSDTDVGRLRITMAEFFRISGGSTQLKGVEPDIVFPSGLDAADHGERSLDNALPWDRISPASYRRVGTIGTTDLARRSTERVASDPGFEMLLARGELLQQINDQKTVSLRQADREEESKQRDRVLKDQRNEFLQSQGIAPVDEDAEDVDEELLDQQTEVIARIQVEEAARILSDAILLHQVDRPRAAMRD